MEEFAPGRVRLSVAEARAVALRALGAVGYDAADAGLITDHVIDAALCGYEYSGLAKILNIVEDPRFRNPRKPVAVVHETPVSALMDGGNNCGMVALVHAVDLAIRKAVESGICLVAIANSWQSGRHAHFAERIARAGLIGIQIESTRGNTVAPPGAAAGALGTNPFAFAIPTGHGPFVFDMGTAALMNTDLMLRVRTGQPLPGGVAIGADGAPTTDPVEATAGALLTFGGYKGFGLSMVAQMFGVLAGCTLQTGRPHGAVIVAFRPDIIAPADRFAAETAALIDRIKATPRQPGVEAIRLPSERAFASRDRLAEEGIEVNRLVLDALAAL